jgi:hypothetical protein
MILFTMRRDFDSLTRGGSSAGGRPGRACACLLRTNRMALMLMAAVGVASVARGQAGGFRSLTPGVLTVIPADTSAADPLQRGELIEVTEGLKASNTWTPKRAASTTTLLARGLRVEYPRDIWCLEFAFKPPRMMAVDVPASAEQMRRVNVLYLVYRVKNLGARRVVTHRTDAAREADPVERVVEAYEQPVRFLPHFVLETREGLTAADGISSYRAYLDRVVPSALAAVRLKEDPARPLLDSAAMSATEIAPGEERWGVAIWEGIDPRIDYFSIYVQGLTNAIRWRPRADRTVAAADPPGRHVEQTLKSLRLDFWRPGDAAAEKISVGYRGMFERMALGGRLLTALGWPRHTASRPQVGLQRLGLSWDDPGLQEPAGSGLSLLPLETIFQALATVDDPDARSLAARDLFGDVGVEAVEELVRAAAGSVDPTREAARRVALEQVGLTPEQVEAKPLASLARIARSLEAVAGSAERRKQAAGIFGPAAPRLEWLARAAIIARVLATLEATSADPVAIARMDARDALEAAAVAIKASPAPEQEKLARGLFGGEGPELLAEALATHEGETYSWIFRYED